MTGSHHPVPVVLSVVIAILASYTALQLAGRVSAATGWVRRVWLASGSIAMGVGIWSMHFVAMLAFHLPVPIQYDIPLWLLSIASAILASMVALYIASRPRVSTATLGAGALLMGAGIAGMHYTGMAAVRIPGYITYDPFLVSLSVAIAVFCAFVALVLALRFRDARTRQAAWAMAGSGVVMGFAIAGLHYTAMAAASFTPAAEVHIAHDGHLLASRELTVAVVIGTLLILGLALLGSLLDRRLRIREEEAAELRESRRAMATLLGNLPGMAYRCQYDAARRLEFASAGALELTGYSPEDLVANEALSFTSLIHPADAAAVSAEIQAAIHERRSFQLTYRLNSASGDEKWVLEQGQAVFSPTGEVLGIEGFATDITARTRAEEELRRARDAAEAANRAKSDFLASMSHELRTPLNSVIGFANVLRKNKQGNLRAQDLQYLERIVGSGKHLLRLINDVLDLSKIEAGKMEVDFASVSLNSLINETIAELQGSVRDGMVLQAKVPASDLVIQSDAQKLKQVLINLLGNALKFTEHGSVTLAVDVDQSTGRPWQIQVQDTGIGIPPERLAQIFQPFEQAESGTARRFGGTGLGLAISSSLCELMGYRLNVISAVGVGSTFQIQLETPLAAAKGGSSSAAVRRGVVVPLPNVSEAKYEGKRVLLVDDDEDARILLQEHLAEFDCQVRTASSGEEGLRLAREQRPHLIILDLLMPEMNGWEVMRHLSRDPELRDVPVVVISALPGGVSANSLSVVDFVAKPIERDEIARVLSRRLRSEHRRVLVVDDDENARLLVCACLGDEDIEVRTAANGLEALKVLQGFAPDVVVLDLMMPELDGMAFLARARKEVPHFTPSVVVVTAKDLDPIELERLNRDTTAVLEKNGELETELRRVLQHLWGSQEADSPQVLARAS